VSLRDSQQLAGAATPIGEAIRPDVSVVVPTDRRPALLERCLDLLATQTLAARRYEIIVCDDGPDDMTRSLVARLADVHRARGLRVLYVPITTKQGSAAARNVGWRRARAPIIAFTDDDTLPDAHWLEEGLAAMATGAEAAAGAIVVPIPRRPTDYEADASGLAHADFATANAFVRRDALRVVGGFDERFTDAWREDSDLHFAILRSGGMIVPAKAAIVVHPVRPARWGISLAQQKKSRFDALLCSKHRRLYKRRIASRPPIAYYASISAALVALLGALRGVRFWEVLGALVWLALTLRFFSVRMRGRSLRWQHVAEMAVTSALIPFLSIYWRVRGAIRYRTWFL
jgi:GT2 family glycosyltransferase